jgi:hypothetical protein
MTFRDRTKDLAVEGWLMGISPHFGIGDALKYFGPKPDLEPDPVKALHRALIGYRVHHAAWVKEREREVEALGNLLRPMLPPVEV